MSFVAYYWVSTDRQGAVRLGLEAQRAAVTGYIAGRGDLFAEFVEVESGRKSDRPQLAAALDACRRQQATLVIAKLDRLARNVAFIATLMERGAAFVAVDNPHAEPFMLHLLAAFAEHEQRPYKSGAGGSEGARRKCTTTNDASIGPTRARSTNLTEAEKAIVVEFRRRTLLPLDDVLGCLRETIPALSRSAPHRCQARIPGSNVAQAAFPRRTTAPAVIRRRQVCARLPSSRVQGRCWRHFSR